MAVPVPDHAGRQGHGGPRRVQDHQGATETSFLLHVNSISKAGWVALIPSLYG